MSDELKACQKRESTKVWRYTDPDPNTLILRIATLEAELAQTKALVERLIEAGNDVSLLEFSVERFEKWHALVREWKEGEK